MVLTSCNSLTYMEDLCGKTMMVCLGQACASPQEQKKVSARRKKSNRRVKNENENGS